MSYPWRFVQVRYADWDVTTWSYGHVTDDAVVRLDFERDVEMACRLARDCQRVQIVPSIHYVTSSRPSSHWNLYDPARPWLLAPHSVRWQWRIGHHGNPQIAEVRWGARSVNDLFVALDNAVDGNPEVWEFGAQRDTDLIARLSSLADPRTATDQEILAVLGAHNDIRGWQEGTGPGGKPSKIPVSDKRGQGLNANAVLETLLVEEGGFPPSEGLIDPVDYMRNRRSRLCCEVLGGQAETTIELGGGGGGGYAGGAWRGPDPFGSYPLTNWGFGLVGDWRRHFSVLARVLHGVDARDPLARAAILDKAPDCRDRLMIREWQEPRLNGGFAAQNPAHALLHEGMGHGANIDIHNPDLFELLDGSLVFGVDAQRRDFVTYNAIFLESLPEPEPEPEPEPVRLLDISVPVRISVRTNRSASFTVAGQFSDGGERLVTPTTVHETSQKFSAAVVGDRVVVTAGSRPGDGYLTVRCEGVEKIVSVSVTKR